MQLIQRFHRLSPFYIHDPPPTKTYTLSLHDALPISTGRRATPCGCASATTTIPAPTRASPPVSSLSRKDRKSTRLNSSHPSNSYAVVCLKKKKKDGFV